MNAYDVRVKVIKYEKEMVKKWKEKIFSEYPEFDVKLLNNMFIVALSRFDIKISYFDDIKFSYIDDIEEIEKEFKWIMSLHKY
jgi:hypothetical protein